MLPGVQSSSVHIAEVRIGSVELGLRQMTSVSKSIHLGDARVALILNAKSGKKDGEARVEELVENIRGSVRGLSVRPVRQGSELIPTVRSAIEQGTDIIAAFGGDGTQAAVAGVVAGSGVAMAVLPGGTFNYFARELGVDTIESALDALRTGEIAERDVGRINDRVFINNASVGLYPQILQNREDIYKRWGRSRIAAYWSVLVGLRDLTSPMRLRVSYSKRHAGNCHALGLCSTKRLPIGKPRSGRRACCQGWQVCTFLIQGSVSPGTLGIFFAACPWPHHPR